LAGHDGAVPHSENARLPATAAHVFVDDLGAPHLAEPDAHHLARVLRLRDGEAVTVADGRGGWRLCAFRDGPSLEPTGPITRAVELRPVVVAFALTKGDKPELAVQKLTELGVDRVVPLAAARCVVQWDDKKTERNLARLREVARAAAMQSRRAFLPTVERVMTVAELAASEAGLALAHPGGGPISDPATPVAIGPEGGWSDEELAAVPHRVDLGATTLRAETAALAAGVLLTALRESRVSPGPSS
jgi:16S rRNA (uracil1498-N3)-methyltransferase